MVSREELAQVQSENMKDLERGVSEEVLHDLGYTATQNFDDVVDQGRLDAGNFPGTVDIVRKPLVELPSREKGQNTPEMIDKDAWRNHSPEQEATNLGGIATARAQLKKD